MSLSPALTAVTVALSMRVVGILLVAALMVLPVSAAGRIAWSMRSTLVLAMAIGVGSAVSGLTVSYYADLPPGGTIVLAAAAAYLVALCRHRGPQDVGRDYLALRRDERCADACLVAAAATRLVLLRGADHDRLARVRRRRAVHEALRRRRRAPAAMADRLELVHELGVGQELGHRPERESPEVLIEARDHDACAAVRELERGRDDAVPEELRLVDSRRRRSPGRARRSPPRCRSGRRASARRRD